MGAEHDALVAAALRDLEAVSTRDLIRSARALEAKYNHDAAGMFRFSGVLRSFAHGRQLGGEQWLARIQLSGAILLAHDCVAELLADAPEPFWRHVREALALPEDDD